MMHSLGRRLTAARALGGFDSQKALALAIDRPGLSARTIRAIEADDPKASFPEHKQQWVADACGIDRQFFTVDLAHLPLSEELTPERALSVLQRLVGVGGPASGQAGEGSR